MDEITDLIKKEEKRQEDTLMLIPSENYSSKAIRKVLGSKLSNKYSEGYPGRRYYQGNVLIDEIENLAIERAKELFFVEHANVQPYSGSPANSAVLFALLSPGDKILGMNLSAGGHLTHGHPNITFSGKYFKSIQFGLNKKGVIDYEKTKELVEKERPKLLIIGTTAYPLIIDWKKFSDISKSVNAYLVTDISHIAGLIVSDVYPSPSRYADVITTTTHKTLRGPRGAMIMVTKKGLKKDAELGSKIDRAVFPGLQGGPHNNTTAAIAVCLYEASFPSFKKYGEAVVRNAKTLANELTKGELEIVSGGTDSHLMVIDLRKQKLSGNIVSEALEIAGLVVNKNSVPNDNMPFFYPSGIRLGTPAVTTRGMGTKEMKKIADWILQVINHIKKEKLPEGKAERFRFLKEYRKKIKKDTFLINIAKKVKTLCKQYPTP